MLFSTLSKIGHAQNHIKKSFILTVRHRYPNSNQNTSLKNCSSLKYKYGNTSNKSKFFVSVNNFPEETEVRSTVTLWGSWKGFPWNGWKLSL